MAPEIRWSEKSTKNLLHIYDYIAFDSHFYAERFIKKLVSSVEKQLQLQPNSGRSVPEFTNTRLKFLKEVIFKGYRIIYNPDQLPIRITIIAILNAKMDVPKHIDASWIIE